MTSESVSWTALRDLPATWEESISDELSALRDVWFEQTKELLQSKTLADCNAVPRKIFGSSGGSLLPTGETPVPGGTLIPPSLTPNL
jgi:hypothetical protein